MFDFSELNAARLSVKHRDHQRQEDYSACLQEALAELAAFQTAPGRDRADCLYEAACLLSEALEYQRSQPEAYLALACIFYVLHEIKLATRYLQFARSLAPDAPGVAHLEALLVRQASQQITTPPRYRTGKLVHGTGKLKSLSEIRRTGGLKKQTGKLNPGLLPAQDPAARPKPPVKSRFDFIKRLRQP